MIGKPSVFDRPEWLQISPGREPRSGFQPMRRFRVLTRLPRLTWLVRAVRDDPTDDVMASKAVRLAKELTDLDWKVSDIVMEIDNGARKLDCVRLAQTLLANFRCRIQINEEWEAKPSIVQTSRAVDAGTVPFSFQWRQDVFSSAVGLNLWWACKIMLSGLCQSLYACGAPIYQPSLTELYEEERRCAMCISMSVDYFNSFAPYACVVTLVYLQIAWGVYWRQKDLPTNVDMYEMAEWLRRRGNEFLTHLSPMEMRREGLAFNTERYMGGHILPPEVFDDEPETLNNSGREINMALRNVPESMSTSVTDDEPQSAFREGMANMILHNRVWCDKSSLFQRAIRNVVFDAEYLT